MRCCWKQTMQIRKAILLFNMKPISFYTSKQLVEICKTEMTIEDICEMLGCDKTLYNNSLCRDSFSINHRKKLAEKAEKIKRYDLE